MGSYTASLGALSPMSLSGLLNYLSHISASSSKDNLFQDSHGCMKSCYIIKEVVPFSGNFRLKSSGYHLAWLPATLEDASTVKGKVLSFMMS